MVGYPKKIKQKAIATLFTKKKKCNGTDRNYLVKADARTYDVPLDLVTAL